MDIVTIDTETYYDKEYSLSKMTTESYVRDPRFEVIGVGVKVNDHPTDFYSGSDPGRFLKSLDYRDKAILCHNTAFDGFILSHHFGIRPKFWMDTMSMARPAHAMTSGVSLKALASFYSLGAKGDEVVNALGKRRADFSEQDMARYASYCVNDVDLTYQLFLRLRKGFPAIELRIIDLTLRMFTEPEIELNRAVLERYLAAVIARKEELLNAVEGVDKADLMSNPKMAQLLTQLNVIPPTKISARTGKETLAFGKTDRAFLDLLDHPDERVQTLVAARLGVKSTLAETRATSLIGVSERGRLPIMLNYYGAHTGRFSGGDKMNLQNLPSGGALRESLQAPKGKMLLACDSAQIEARVVAYIADQGDLVQAFREGRDVYSEFATEVYGKPVSKADKLERFVGKTCVAEGTLVLTQHRGEIPIEEITLEDRVWDGIEWVSHGGLIYQGEKDVITYQGLTATEDHGVFTKHGPLPFGIAASRLETLITSGNAGHAVRVSEDHLPANSTPWQAHILVREMYELWRREMDKREQSDQRKISWLPILLSNQITVLRSIGETLRCYNISMQQTFGRALQELRWPWDSGKVCFTHGVHLVGRTKPTAQRLSWCRDRPYKQQWTLRTGQPTAGYAQTANSEQAQYGQDFVGRKVNPDIRVSFTLHHLVDIQTRGQTRTIRGRNPQKVRVYDILNAGPRRRFTANGKLVFNCILGLGYGMGGAKLKHTLGIGVGGIKAEVTEGEAQRIVSIYRTKNHKIATFWNRCNHALNHIYGGTEFAIVPHIPTIVTSKEAIALPNGMQIRYPVLLPTPNHGYAYAGERQYRDAARRRILGEQIDTTNFTKIYGGKVTENIVQALARIVVAEQMVKIAARYKVVLQVHDEVVILCDEDDAENAKAFMLEVMSTPPSWAPDLPVSCEAHYGHNFGECK